VRSILNNDRKLVPPSPGRLAGMSGSADVRNQVPKSGFEFFVGHRSPH
jgi:hypothetical protein